MIGAIIGDIVGSRFEFGDPPQKGFELFTSECNYTDDTICTVAVADAVLRGIDYGQSLKEWCRRYPNPMGGYGNRFYHWLFDEGTPSTDSFGNGSAMRVSSIGWLFDDYDSVKEQSRRSAVVSQSHPEGIKGAQCVASLIYWLRTCRITKEQVAASVKRSFGYEIPPMRDILRIGSHGHFDGTCQETVPMAIRCFLDAESFEETVRLAVLCDGDTDTKAAIAGSIAEAYYEIPTELLEQAFAYLPAEMLDVLQQFLRQVKDNIG